MVDIITIAEVVVPAIIVIAVIGSGVFRVKANEVGMLVRKFSGKPMPQGQVIARKGQIGTQVDVLPPNLYFRLPLFWGVRKGKITVIEKSQIGIISAIDGRPLPQNRLLGDEVESNSYQDGGKFLDNGGFKGPQIGIMRPGNYRVNTQLFSVTPQDATIIPAGQTGLVTAQDGITLPSKLLIAPVPLTGMGTDVDTTFPKARPHAHFQDGQAFIDSRGYRGTQLDTLQSGTFYLNRNLFDVEIIPQTEIKPGYVGVLRSNVGEELDRSKTLPTLTVPTPDQETIAHDVENVLTNDKMARGILSEPLAPGKYNLNTYAYTMYPVPVSAIMVDWSSSDRPVAPVAIPSKYASGAPMDTTPSILGIDFFKFNQLNVTSKDGFPLEVDVRMIIRILPENAAFVIARFGTIDNLIQQIVHPLIDATFRNNAGSRGALDFFQARTELQDEAFERAKEIFKEYHIEAQGLLISYVLVPQQLLDTQTFKQIALQQQTQYSEQAKAEAQRIDVETKTAIANKQGDVVAAQLQVPINQNNAMALVMQSQGIRDSTMIQTDGNAYQVRKTGEAIADAYNAQASVLGSDKVAALKLMDEIQSGHVKIVPDVYVQGTGGGDGTGNNALLTTYLATLLNAASTDKPKYEPKTADQFQSSLAKQAGDLIESQKMTMQSQPVVQTPSSPPKYTIPNPKTQPISRSSDSDEP